LSPATRRAAGRALTQLIGASVSRRPVSAPSALPARLVPGPNPAAKPESVRRDKPHVSVYLDKRVQKVIKEIALAYDRHDLHIERVTHRPNCTAINQAAAKCRLCL